MKHISSWFRGSRHPKGAEARGGFVLLEAVVALAILGVASIVLLQVRAQQIRVATQARELLTAQALAEDRIAAIRLLDFQLLSDPPDSLLEGVFPEPFGAFRWTAQVARMEEEYDLFGVEVVVEGPAERFPLRTLMHRTGALTMAAGGEAMAGGGMGGMGGGRGAMGGGQGRMGGQGGRGAEGQGRGGGPGGMQGGQPPPGRGGGGSGGTRPPGGGGGGGAVLDPGSGPDPVPLPPGGGGGS